MGVVILPMVVSCYSAPKTVDEVYGQIAGKALDVLHIETPAFKRYSGFS
jgi:3-polyprenyl-4-hydroxybenzoate decarboxylase